MAKLYGVWIFLNAVGTILHSEWPKLYEVLTILSAINLLHSECNRVLCCTQNGQNYGVLAILRAINPIALRTAKALWSLDHSECNRVPYYTQNSGVYSEQPKLCGV